jgi:phospholipid/cholesterol/gamma-HCH transport system substrate-binding protein
VATTILNDKDYFDDLLNTLPDAYRVLGRQALGGDYFSFYLCELVLKMNGKGGQPVYIKLAGQDTGRCTPQ